MKTRKRCKVEGCTKPRAGGNAGKYCTGHARESMRASQRNWRRSVRKQERPAQRRETNRARTITECECACHELAMRLIAGKL